MEYSKFSEMVSAGVKNEHSWRLRAVKPEWENSPLMFQLLNTFIWWNSDLSSRLPHGLPGSSHGHRLERWACSFSRCIAIITASILMMMRIIPLDCVGCSNSWRRKADVLAQHISHRWSSGSASLAPRWFYPWGRRGDHWQVNTGDSSFHISLDNGTVHRARGRGLGRWSWIWIWTRYLSDALETSGKVQHLFKEGQAKIWRMSWPSAGCSGKEERAFWTKASNKIELRTFEELKEGPCGWRVVNKGESSTSWCSRGKQMAIRMSHPTVYNPCRKRATFLGPWVERMTLIRPT